MSYIGIHPVDICALPFTRVGYETHILFSHHDKSVHICSVRLATYAAISSKISLVCQGDLTKFLLLLIKN